MPQSKISICIPTYNRAAYLDWQLNQFLNFKEKIVDWEFVICNNGSTDNTREVIAKYKDELRITYHEFPKNMGPQGYYKTVEISSSNVLTYLADDDFLDVDAVNSYVSLFNEDKNLSAIFAPWKYLNAVKAEFNGQFYSQKEDLIVKQFDYLSATTLILQNKIFPEIFITKKNIALSLFEDCDICYHFFLKCAQLIKSGNVIFANIPFFYSITQHPADGNTTRIQAGNEQIKSYWDIYRGGFELLLGLSRIQNNSFDQLGHKLLLDNFVTDRMILAIVNNIRSGEFLKSYWIYLRVIAQIGPFELNQEFTFKNIIGLAALDLIINETRCHSDIIILDISLDKGIRTLANEYCPKKYFLNNENILEKNTLNEFHIDSNSHLEAVKKLNFFGL